MHRDAIDNILHSVAVGDTEGDVHEIIVNDDTCFGIETTSLDQKVSMCDKDVEFNCGSECSTK